MITSSVLDFHYGVLLSPARSLGMPKSRNLDPLSIADSFPPIQSSPRPKKSRTEHEDIFTVVPAPCSLIEPGVCPPPPRAGVSAAQGRRGPGRGKFQSSEVSVQHFVLQVGTNNLVQCLTNLLE